MPRIEYRAVKQEREVPYEVPVPQIMERQVWNNFGKIRLIDFTEHMPKRRQINSTLLQNHVFRTIFQVPREKPYQVPVYKDVPVPKEV